MRKGNDMREKSAVRIWEEKIIIPTYPACAPEKYPLFLEKRAYQGSTGKVYPLPVTEKIAEEKEDQEYKAVFLENEYLKIMVLPELGGRIQRAYDKTNGYDFVYYNHVIKPALVGLTGPWISGGIEFNWPQHHRPSTYAPVDYKMETKGNGSCTVYLSETDKMYGTKGMAAISLYPGKAFIEIRGQLYNPTELPQTFLWWANPAVPVNDDTYSVFPPDVTAVMDHGKRAVSTFPIATGEYYKQDYSAGVDISRYKNVKVPTSYMAAHSDFDFIGNYDEKKQAGLLHVADHHISPGKKQWTWGNSDFGRSWDRNLTETDGPYIELMTGVFTDNQPDFTWLKPGEEKTFVQYFMPYKGVGRVGNATKDAAVSLEKADQTLKIKVYASGQFPDALIRLEQDGRILFQEQTDLFPEKCYVKELTAPFRLAGCKVSVIDQDKELVSYQVYEPKLEPVPKPAEPMKEPKDMKSTEELYLAATHLEQYRHATFDPAEYYLEGLRRDQTDIRLNNGYGLLLYKRGQIKESIDFFKEAIHKQTWKNPNPYLGECCYNLGLALEMDGQYDEAYENYFKSTWSAETQNSGFLALSGLESRKKNYAKAEEFATQSMLRNWHDMKARTRKAAMLRLQKKDNRDLLRESLEIDPLCMGCLYEKALMEQDFSDWKKYMRNEEHNYLELALDYVRAGLYKDSEQILKFCEHPDGMRFYYLGWIAELQNDTEKAEKYFEEGEQREVTSCFPHRLEEIKILKMTAAVLDEAPKAHCYLGDLFYDKKQYDNAIREWECSAEQDPDYAPALRNLAIASYNKKNDAAGAMEYLKRACRFDQDYPRIWLEYDQLAAKIQVSIEERLHVMEEHPGITSQRDDLTLRYITLLNCSGQYEKAFRILMGRHFHPWEGGEGKVSAQYKFSLIQMAKEKMNSGKEEEAEALLKHTLQYPDNLGEGKLPNTPDHEAYYYLGLVNRMKENPENAQKYFELAAAGQQTPEPVLYYNDQPSDFIYYQGLANRELGREDLAQKAFHQLITYGERHLFDQTAYDFFAVSLPEIEVFQDDIKLRNVQYCNCLRALGYLGIGDKEKASTLIQEILERQNDYQIMIPFR